MEIYDFMNFMMDNFSNVQIPTQLINPAWLMVFTLNVQ